MASKTTSKTTESKTDKLSAQAFTALLKAGRARIDEAVDAFVQAGLQVGVIGHEYRDLHVAQYGEKDGAKRFLVWYMNVTGLSRSQVYHLLSAARSFGNLPARSVARTWASDQLAELAPVADDPRKLAAAVKAAGRKPNREAVKTAVRAQLPKAEATRRRAASTKATKAADAALARKYARTIEAAMATQSEDPRALILVGVIVGAGMAKADSKTATRFGRIVGGIVDGWIAEQAS